MAAGIRQASEIPSARPTPESCRHLAKFPWWRRRFIGGMLTGGLADGAADGAQRQLHAFGVTAQPLHQAVAVTYALHGCRCPNERLRIFRSRRGRDCSGLQAMRLLPVIGPYRRVRRANNRLSTR